MILTEIVQIYYENRSQKTYDPEADDFAIPLHAMY